MRNRFSQKDQGLSTTRQAKAEKLEAKKSVVRWLTVGGWACGNMDMYVMPPAVFFSRGDTFKTEAQLSKGQDQIKSLTPSILISMACN